MSGDQEKKEKKKLPEGKSASPEPRLFEAVSGVVSEVIKSTTATQLIKEAGDNKDSISPKEARDHELTWLLVDAPESEKQSKNVLIDLTKIASEKQTATHSAIERLSAYSGAHQQEGYQKAADELYELWKTSENPQEKAVFAKLYANALRRQQYVEMGDAEVGTYWDQRNKEKRKSLEEKRTAKLDPQVQHAVRVLAHSAETVSDNKDALNRTTTELVNIRTKLLDEQSKTGKTNYNDPNILFLNDAIARNNARLEMLIDSRLQEMLEKRFKKEPLSDEENGKIIEYEKYIEAQQTKTSSGMMPVAAKDLLVDSIYRGPTDELDHAPDAVKNILILEQARMRRDPELVKPDNLEDIAKRLNDAGGVLIPEEDERLVREAIKRVRHVQGELYKNINKQNQQGEKMRDLVVTWADVKEKGRAWLVPTAADMTHHRDEDRMSFRSGYFTERDVDTIMNKGPEEWFYDYADRVFGMGKERSQPTFSQQQKYQGFQDFMIFLYGDQAPAALVEFEKHWSDRGRIDYVVRSMALGTADSRRVFEAMGSFQGADVDYLMKNFEYAENANQIMEHELHSLMWRKLEEYKKHEAWLDGKVQNAFFDTDWKSYKSSLDQKGLEAKYGKKVAELFGKQELTRIEYEKVLNIVQTDKFEGKDFSARYQEQHFLHQEIGQRRDKAARGVILEDYDVMSWTEVYIQHRQALSYLDILERKSADQPLSERDQKQMEFLREQQEKLWKKLTDREASEFGHVLSSEERFDQSLHKRGLSPLENRVYDSLHAYIVASTGQEPPEWKIRYAIWAARSNMMATGRMAAIGAKWAIAPGERFESQSGAHVMVAPAFEDLQRSYNPDVFAHRFGMGGDMGEVVRGILRKHELKDKGFSDKEIEEEWHHVKSTLKSDEQKMAAAIAEIAERDMKIDFRELLYQGYLASGGQYDGSAWRLAESTITEIRNYYLDLKQRGKLTGDVLDNQALGVRFLVARNATERRAVLEKMSKRTPTKFFQMLNVETVHSALTKAGLSEKDWDAFQSHMGLVEMRLWDQEKANWNGAPDPRMRNVDLAKEADFSLYATPVLEKLKDESGNPLSQETMEKYRKAIGAMQESMASDDLFAKLAEGKLALTMSLTDFSWKDADFFKLGNLAFPRRVRDNEAMTKARNIILSFITNSEHILSPDDPKESLMKVLELRNAINDYASPDTAEDAAKKIMRVLIEFNRDRSLWSFPSWIPGGKWVGLQLAELDMRKSPDYRGPVGNFATRVVGLGLGKTVGTAARLTSKFKPAEKAMNWLIPGWSHIAEHPDNPEHWPHAVAESISYSVRFTGAHGNKWNETDIRNLIATAQDMGIFNKHPEYALDLIGEYKATIGWRAAAIVRRYWWVVVVAALIVAASQSLEDEKKKAGSGGGGGGGHH